MKNYLRAVYFLVHYLFGLYLFFFSSRGGLAFLFIALTFAFSVPVLIVLWWKWRCTSCPNFEVCPYAFGTLSSKVWGRGEGSVKDDEGIILFISFFILSIWPFFAVIMNVIDAGFRVIDFIFFVILVLLAVVELLHYRKLVTFCSSDREVDLVEEITETAIVEISRIEELLKLEMEREKKIGEQLDEVKEKIEGAVG